MIGAHATRHAVDDRLTVSEISETYFSALRTKSYGRSAMPSNATARAAEVRAKRREQRVMIDGRLTSTIAPTHGVVWIYLAYSCRCKPCTEANTAYIREARSRNYREGRTWVPASEEYKGHWEWLPGPHGSASTYVTRGCRCKPCTEAIRVARAESRNK